MFGLTTRFIRPLTWLLFGVIREMRFAARKADEVGKGHRESWMTAFSLYKKTEAAMSVLWRFRSKREALT